MKLKNETKLENVINSFSEEKQSQILEIMEVLLLAERPANISTRSAEMIFENTRNESLNQAQTLFNNLKESYFDDTNGMNLEASTVI